MSYEYYRGNLAAARAELLAMRELSLRYPMDDKLRSDIDQLKAHLEASDRAWMDCCQGKVTLVQRRLGDQLYSYLALPLTASGA